MKLTDADNAADGIFFPALEQNMMGAVLINENDEVMFFNPAAEKLWGYKREEVIGNNIDILIPRDLRPAHPEYIRHNREGGKARVEGMSRELQLEKKDGSKIWTRFALSKVSAEGKVYYLALVRDASVEMAQKEQTRQLIIAVDHLDRPVIVLDPERHIVQCNRAFTEMFGYCISEASGMQPDTLLNIPEFPADNRIRLQQLLWKTARDQDEFLLLTRTGEKIWIKASISPVYDVLAHLQNLVMTFSDITEERQIRQLEGNILAAMCSSPPFHEMGEIICRNIESVLNESHVSLFALRNGMPIHWASSSHGAEIQNKVNVAEYPSLRVTYLYLNNSKAPLNQADLRRAISWSTDYQGMVNGILSGNGKQMRGPIPEGMWGYDATAMQYNHDETKAKAEWDKVTSKPTSLTFLYSDNDPNWEPIALATQSSLNKLGIIVKLEKLANATMRDRVGKGDYDIAIGNWSPDFADPYMFMNYWFESDKKGLPGNRSFYENSEVDKLLRNALATTDQTQRTRDYQQAQKIVIDDAAYVYLFQKNYQLAMNKEVKGFVFNPMLEQVFNINTMSK